MCWSRLKELIMLSSWAEPEKLTSCFCNLMPFRNVEEEKADGQLFGFYIRCKDSSEQHAVFTRPVFEVASRKMGGAEFKNWSNPVTASHFKRFVELVDF